MENEPPSYEETTQNATQNEASGDEKIKVWKFDLSLTFIKSIGGIFNVVLIVRIYIVNCKNRENISQQNTGNGRQNLD